MKRVIVFVTVIVFQDKHTTIFRGGTRGLVLTKTTTRRAFVEGIQAPDGYHALYEVVGVDGVLVTVVEIELSSLGLACPVFL
jgi:prolipoprotein diacylglyceryltransferase